MITFDTKEIKKTINMIRKSKEELKFGREKYLWLLYSDPDISINEKLRKKIKELVYNTPEPKVYKRTERLLSAIRTKIEDDHIYVYKNEEYLKKGKEFLELSPETGLDPDVHKGGSANKSYAERVEEGYTYHNPGGKTFTNSPRPFTEKTYEELKKQLLSGKIKIDQMLKPLFHEWSR
ncbi:MAG: hypothetical protein ACOCRK_01280 [bacterium]